MNKKLLYLIFTLASFAAYAQPGSLSQSVYRSRVQDSTAAIAANVSAIAAGYAPMFFNDQATTPHWDIWNGSSYDHIFAFGSGSGLPAAYTIDQVTTSTAGGTITLDMNSQIQRSHVGSATFSAAKIFALSNTTNSLFFNFFFEVTNVAAVITVPSDWQMSSTDFDGADWTPPEIGKYEIGGSFDDVNNIWYVKIAGPFQ